MEVSTARNLANDPLQQTEKLLGFLNDKIPKDENLVLERLDSLLDIAQAISDFAGPQIADSLTRSAIVEELTRKIPQVSNPIDTCRLFSKMTVLFASLGKLEEARFYYENAKTKFDQLPTGSVKGKQKLTAFQMLSVLPFFACAQAVIGETEAAERNFSKAILLSRVFQVHPRSQLMTLREIAFFQCRAGFFQSAISTVASIPDPNLRAQTLDELDKPARFRTFAELVDFVNLRLHRLKIELAKLRTD